MRSGDKTVIFINTKEFSNRAALAVGRIARRNSGETLAVYFNSAIPAEFNSAGVDLKLSEDFLAPEDYDAIDKYVITLMRAWYLNKGRDGKGITMYDGVDLGSMTEFSFHEFLTFRIKNLEVVKRVVAMARPARIVALEDTGELIDAARLVGSASGIAVTALNIKPVKEHIRGFVSRIRGRISDIFYFSLLDRVIRWLLLKRLADNVILIDPRAHAMLTGKHELEHFSFFTIEKGLSNRRYSFKKGGMYVSFDIPLSGRMRAATYAEEFRTRWGALKHDAAFRGSFVYNGIHIWKLIEDQLSEFFIIRFPKILNIMEQVKRFHSQKKIKTIVLRGDGREKEKAIITSAKLLNIPTLFMTHGVLAENNGHDILYCAKTAVWGRADFERYVHLGNPPETLVITGGPKYDRLISETAYIPKTEIYKNIGMDPARDFIMLATHPVGKFSSYNTYDEMEVLLRCVLAAIKYNSGPQLLIKLHPFDDYSMYKRVLRRSNAKDVFLVRDMDSISIIRASSLVLTFGSTIGLEAMMLDKPVIAINLSKRRDLLPYVLKGGAAGVYKPEELGPAIKTIFSDRALGEELALRRREVASYYMYKLDGQSSERVAVLINNLAGA